MPTIIDLHATGAAGASPFTTRDGERLTLRRVGHDDAPIVTYLLLRLSARTRQLRYHMPRHFSLEDAWRETGRICRPRPDGGIALAAVAPRPWGDEALGVAELVPDARDPAIGHLGIVVRDDYQARGIGTALLRLLLDRADEGPLADLRATILAENVAARRLLDRLARPHTTRTRDGVIEARLATDPSCPLRSAT